MALRVEVYRAELRRLKDWEPYLKKHSGLPGPRANLELVHAVGDEADADRLWRLSASTDEFLALCGTAGLGARRAVRPAGGGGRPLRARPRQRPRARRSSADDPRSHHELARGDGTSARRRFSSAAPGVGLRLERRCCRGARKRLAVLREMVAVQGQGRGVGDEDQPREGAHGRPPRGNLDARDGEAETKSQSQTQTKGETENQEPKEEAAVDWYRGRARGAPRTVVSSADLAALEDDDRDLALRQSLLLRWVRHRFRELVSLLRLGDPRSDLERFRTQLDSGNRTGEQVVVPRRRGRRTVVRGDHDQEVAGATVTEHRRSCLSAARAGRRQNQHAVPCHGARELSMIGAEVGDHFRVERLHIRRLRHGVFIYTSGAPRVI